MSDDDDRALDLIGVILVAFILVAVVVGLFAVVALSPGDETGPPDAEWTLTRVNDTHVQIGHVGGDAVAREDLVVTVDGTERSATFPERLSRGDAGLVRASPGATVRLYWTGGSGDRELLAEWTTNAAVAEPVRAVEGRSRPVSG